MAIKGDGSSQVGCRGITGAYGWIDGDGGMVVWEAVVEINEIDNGNDGWVTKRTKKKDLEFVARSRTATKRPWASVMGVLA